MVGRQSCHATLRVVIPVSLWPTCDSSSVCPYLAHPSTWAPACPSVHLPACLPNCVIVCLPACPPARPPACRPTSFAPTTASASTARTLTAVKTGGPSSSQRWAPQLLPTTATAPLLLLLLPWDLQGCWQQGKQQPQQGPTLRCPCLSPLCSPWLPPCTLQGRP